MLLHRLARTLLVAGGCGLASVALAGNDPTPASSSPASAMPQRAAQARLEAIRVELAILGDRAAYNQGIEVVLVDDTILLKGQVQDEATHKRVVEVARQNSYLPVADALSTVASTAARALPTVPLYKAVRDALVRHLGSKADRFQIYTSEDGLVTLKGEVGSAEEKLAASRALRGLAGCSRVSNCLEVRTVHQAGHAITMVSSDGQAVVCTPTEPAPSEAVPHTVQRVQATSEEMQPALPRIHTPATHAQPPATIPSGLSPTRTITVSTTQDGREVSRPVTYVVPTSSGYASTGPVIHTPATVKASCPQCATKPFHEGVVLPEIESHPKERPILDKLFAWKNARGRQCATPELTAASPYHDTTTIIQSPSNYVPQMTAPGKAPVQKPMTVPAPAAQPMNVPDSMVQVGPVVTTPVTQTMPVQQMVAPSQAAPTQMVQTVVEAPRAETWPPAHNVGPVTAAPRSAVYQSRPLAGVAARTGMKQSAEPVPATTVPVMQEQVQMVPQRVEPAMTVPVLPQRVEQKVVVPVVPQQVTPVPTQVKPMPLTPTAAQVPVAPTPFAQPVVTQPRNDRYADAPAPMKMSSKELSERVKASCGKMVRDVKIELGADRKIMVHVYATPATEHLVVGKLLAMPELAASNVKLQLHLAQ